MREGGCGLEGKLHSKAEGSCHPKASLAKASLHKRIPESSETRRIHNSEELSFVSYNVSEEISIFDINI